MILYDYFLFFITQVELLRKIKKGKGKGFIIKIKFMGQKPMKINEFNKLSRK